MRKRIIYAFIALTVMSLGLSLIPSVFSQPENIKILDYSYYVDSAGILDVVGEVQNMGSNTVNPVLLTGSVYYSGGTSPVNSGTKVWVAYLVPQQKAPFYMEFYPPSSSLSGWTSVDISKITLTVLAANATSSYQYPDLKITSNSGKIGTSGDYNGAYMVNGIIQNTGSQTAKNITVVGTFYNSTGTVVAVGYTNYLTPATLDPSGTITFQVAAFDLNQTVVPSTEKISTYSLLVQAQGPILQGNAPIVTPYQGNGSPSPSNSPNSSSPATVSSNNSLNPLTIGAIVIVIVVIAVAGTLIALRKNTAHQTVKESRKARKNR